MSVLGVNGWLGFKKEAVPGTPETGVDTFFPSESFNLHNKPDVIERKADIDAIGKLPGLKGKFLPTGKMDSELSASTAAHVFYWLLGAKDTTTVTTGVYKHTLTMDDDGILPTLTCEADKVIRTERQAGILMDNIEIACSAGNVADLKLGWFGKAHDEAATLSSTPDYELDVLTFVGATVTVDDDDLLDVATADFKLDNQIEQVWSLDGSRYPSDVRRKTAPKFSGKFTFIDYPQGQYDKLQEAETFVLELYFEGEEIGSTGHNAYVKITLFCVQYTGGYEPDIKSDVITTDGEWEGFYSLDETAIISVEVVNGVASLD
jgi:hypothetical protein